MIEHKSYSNKCIVFGQNFFFNVVLFNIEIYKKYHPIKQELEYDLYLEYCMETKCVYLL